MTRSNHPRRAERLLVSAAFATALGNNVQLIVGALLVIREQHTMMAVGRLFIAVAGPQALLSPFFGRLADRFDRRTLWIGCDVTSAALALGLPLAGLWWCPGARDLQRQSGTGRRQRPVLSGRLRVDQGTGPGGPAAAVQRPL
ncbi:hypothetical protein [Streptomyces decoyicus]|uniref:hypothetical protein n=1 Tax=Streptomyces decoyicus TaxID=249567 RepID=UPI003667D20E